MMDSPPPYAASIPSEDDDDDDDPDSRRAPEEDSDAVDDDDDDERTVSYTDANQPAATTTTTTADDAEDDDDDEGSTTLLIRAVPSLSSLLVDSNHKLRPLDQEAICWTLSSAKPGNGVEQLLDTTHNTSTNTTTNNNNNNNNTPNHKDTYWQSDGQQPHSIRVYFARRVRISHVCLYLDYSLDESYTPQHVTIQYGITTQDLQPAVCRKHHHTVTPQQNRMVEFREPTGWCIIPLQAPCDAFDELVRPPQDNDDDVMQSCGGVKDEQDGPIRAYVVEIQIHNMHQNGRDTHVRGIQLFGPKRTQEPTSSLPSSSLYYSHSPAATMQDSANHSSSSNNKKKNERHEPLLPMLPHFSTVDMTQFSSIR